MVFWLFCATMVLLVPAVMIGVGWLFLNRPPKKINGLYGYRTPRSMKSQAAWDFAQHTCGVVWSKVGMALFPLSLGAMVPVMGQDVETAGWWCALVTMVQVVVIVGTILPVERALKRNFDNK